jgi:ketosteroid isomerase-like protein
MAYGWGMGPAAAIDSERSMSIPFVQSLYAAFGRSDIGAILGACAPDVSWQDYGRPSDFPSFGPRQGVAGVQAFFGVLASELEFLQFDPREFNAAGDRVFVLGHSQVRVNKTGQLVDTDWVHVFTVRDGKLAAFTEFADTAQFAEAYRAAA